MSRSRNEDWPEGSGHGRTRHFALRHDAPSADPFGAQSREPPISSNLQVPDRQIVAPRRQLQGESGRSVETKSCSWGNSGSPACWNDTGKQPRHGGDNRYGGEL